MFPGAGEGTRAKVSYELAGRLLGADEPNRAQLAQDMQLLDLTTQPEQTPKKTGETPHATINSLALVSNVVLWLSLSDVWFSLVQHSYDVASLSLCVFLVFGGIYLFYEFNMGKCHRIYIIL